MTTLAIHSETRPLLKPEPRGGPISIRVAREGKADLKFIDDLQKLHSKMVGWMPTVQLETNIKQGNILIAEETGNGEQAMGNGEQAKSIAHSPLPTRIGYCIFKDKYFKREDCGIIYQLNVAPTKQRGLVGAALIKAAFERCPYGVKLFCCWCAQDLQANYFWESLGFVPLAFRTGSRERRKKSGEVSKDARIHIFWQRRICEGDVQTPYWFPSETSGGALKENRIVLPIPPGTHWSDAKPMVLPGAGAGMENGETKALEGDKPRRQRTGGGGGGLSKLKAAAPKRHSIARGRMRFAPGQVAPAVVEARPSLPKPKREKHKNDPKYIAAARELRDRYLEQINTDRMLPEAWGGGGGKYDVSRQLEAASSELKPLSPVHLLKAA